MNKEQKLTAQNVIELENQCKILQQKLDALTISEKRLGMLNAISVTLYNSLDLPGVYDKAVRMVSELMSADITLLYVANETAQVLELAAYQGISPELLPEIKLLKTGGGTYWEVVKTGKGLITEESIGNPPEFNGIFRRLNIHVQMIIPLVFQERVCGMICIGVRPPKQFTGYDRDLMISVGREIAVAIENARLYGIQRRITEQLRLSEGKYRRLFELASDAIFVTDLNGKLIEINRASRRTDGRYGGRRYRERYPAVPFP